MNSSLLATPFSGDAIGLLIIVAIILWTIFWKGLALWVAARNRHKTWFIVLLVINTVGLLDIFYYFFFGRKKLQEPKKSL